MRGDQVSGFCNQCSRSNVFTRYPVCTGSRDASILAASIGQVLTSSDISAIFYLMVRKSAFRPRQTETPRGLFRRRGGRRPGAGRPKTPGAGVPHLRRAPLAARFPVHVTARMGAVDMLRRRDCYRAVQDALRRGGDRFGMRVIEYSVQTNHVHLVCEAADRRALARGVQGLLIRIARGLNRTLGRRGKVFADRYYDRILRTPAEVRNAINYVLHNARRHLGRCGRRTERRWLDPCSSARSFFGLEARWLPEPRTWLMQVGWRRGGRVRVDAVAGRGA